MAIRSLNIVTVKKENQQEVIVSNPIKVWFFWVKNIIFLEEELNGMLKIRDDEVKYFENQTTSLKAELAWERQKSKKSEKLFKERLDQIYKY